MASTNLWFYLNHSFRDLARNGSRTLFALFCIATGVAAVVALRSLAGMIGDELTLNLAELNRGDIQVAPSRELDPRYWERNSQNDRVFSPLGVEALQEWAADEKIGIQFASSESLLQILPLSDDGTLGQPITLIPFLVEPENWPYYGIIRTSEPEVMSLDQALGGRNLVISKRVALSNKLELGDQVIAAGGEEALTIAAFVDDEAEGSVVLRNGPAGLVGFIYYPLERAEDLGLSAQPDRAYLQIPLGRSVKSIEESLANRFGEDVSRITTLDLEEQNQQVADLVNDLVLVMGLSSILIGGMGIINTMNVIVGRRTLEIAVLKTLGLKAWRVTALFLVEAALMGIIGSLIGVLGGIILSYFVRNVGEDVLRTSLTWRAYPEAWSSGFTLGVVITVTFGFLPTLNAGQVRPIGVLRPNDIQLPTTGLSRTLAAVLLTMIIFGLTLNTIVSGKLDLPVELMLGLGGFIIGLFGGVMLANEGMMDDLSDYPPEALSKRGIQAFSGALSALVLVALGAVNLFLSPLSPLLIYGIPLIIGALLYWALRRINIGESIARMARQVLLLGGALILAALVGGGIYAISRTALEILYPRDRELPYLDTFTLISLGLGLLAFWIFRFRVRRAASVVGMALIGASVLSILGFGLGDLLASIFGGTRFWDGMERLSVGIIVVEIIILALGATFSLMIGLVWLLAKTPSFGNVDLKLAFRNINARRTRTASTMIGLIAGIAALSLITLTTSGVTSLLEGQIETNVGGNVVILSRDPDTGLAVKKRLESSLQGVKTFSQFTVYRGRILRVDEEVPQIEGFEMGDAADGNRMELGQSETQEGIGFAFVTIDPTEYQPEFSLKAGRLFTPEDIGKPLMIIREPFRGSFIDQLNLEVGSTVTWRMFPNRDQRTEYIEQTFTIIGIIDRNSEESGTSDGFQAPVGSIPAEIRPDSVVTVADIEDEYVDAAMIEFAQISNAFALEIGFLVTLIEQLVDQLIAIPALVAVLALVAGIAIIANTVALDTQERRHQIGIMKAVGLKGHRVLGQLMFENGFIGLVSGLIGVGIGLVATLLVGVLGEAEQVGQTLHLAPALRLIAMAVLVSLAATLISAWSAARESPMNVLRYE